MVKVKKSKNSSIQSLGAEWQLLAEIVVTGAQKQKREAIDQVIETVAAFHLPERQMEQLKTAITRAVMEEIELIDLGNSRQSVSIRIMASPQATEVHEDPQSFKTSGWGYFLIEKMTEEAWLRGETFCHMIELFLYREGEIQNGWKEKE